MYEIYDGFIMAVEEKMEQRLRNRNIVGERSMTYDEHGLSEAQHDKALRAMAGRKPKFHPGHYGKKFYYHTCGQCGATISVIYDYCYRCGYRILWENPRCLTSYLN